MLHGTQGMSSDVRSAVSADSQIIGSRATADVQAAGNMPYGNAGHEQRCLGGAVILPRLLAAARSQAS
jgi:hypothetical protein